MTRPRYLALLMVTLVTLVAISASVGMVRDDARCTEGFLAETGGLRLELNASIGVSEARLRVQLILEDGRVRWTMVDPQGQVHVIGRSVATPESLRSLQPPAPGTLVLEMEMGETSGRFWVECDRGEASS